MELFFRSFDGWNLCCFLIGARDQLTRKKRKEEKRSKNHFISNFHWWIAFTPAPKLISENRNAQCIRISVVSWSWKEWEVVSILLAWRARAVSLYFLLSPLEFPAHTNSIFSVRHIAVSTAFSSIGESSDCLNCAWSISRAMWEQMRKKSMEKWERSMLGFDFDFFLLLLLVQNDLSCDSLPFKSILDRGETSLKKRRSHHRQRH